LGQVSWVIILDSDTEENKELKKHITIFYIKSFREEKYDSFYLHDKIIFKKKISDRSKMAARGRKQKVSLL
jgi:hypothetical protein